MYKGNWTNVPPDGASFTKQPSVVIILQAKYVINIFLRWVFVCSNPTPYAEPLLQNITWPKLKFEKDMTYTYLNINVTMELQQNPRNFKENEAILDKYILPPFIYY